MNKTVIVINGRGGCGKDTLCDICAKKYKVRNVSSITPIKELAKSAGWNGEKDAKSRKMLADLKQLFTEYNELPNTYLLNQLKEFLNSDEQIMFAHIREGSEIDKFISESKKLCRTLALLVRRNTRDYENTPLGNSSDDDVENYNYDLFFPNDADTLERLEADVYEFMENNII